MGGKTLNYRAISAAWTVSTSTDGRSLSRQPGAKAQLFRALDGDRQRASGLRQLLGPGLHPGAVGRAPVDVFERPSCVPVLLSGHDLLVRDLDLRARGRLEDDGDLRR